MGGTENKAATCKDLKEQIIEKALSDLEFKKALVADPKGTVGKLGVQLPPDVKVKVVEESPGVIYLVLPVNLDELTDKHLDGVAGGTACKDLAGCIPAFKDDVTAAGFCLFKCDPHCLFTP